MSTKEVDAAASMSGVAEIELEDQMRALGEARDALQAGRGSAHHFVDSGHQAIDAAVATARARVDAALLDALQGFAAGEMRVPTGLADAWLLATVPAVAERWHELLDGPMPTNRADPFRRDITRAEYVAERARLNGEIGRRQAELDRRARARRRAELDQEELAATTSTQEGS